VLLASGNAVFFYLVPWLLAIAKLPNLLQWPVHAAGNLACK